MPPDDDVTRFRNPVLDADWPDPDAIRVGEDYYLVCSSFNRVPGLPVLHSRDLVNWRILTHALPELTPREHHELPRHGGGAWAPAIRHHEGTFHVVYPDPDQGILVVSANDPAGPWSPPRTLLRGLGLIDPCPLWDDDGRTWLVHGWAKSRSGVKNRLTVVPVDAGLTTATGPGRTVVDGDDLPGFTTLEGPKLHRRDGWYWIFAPAGGVGTGWQSAFRSRSVLGPYEERTVLHQGGTDVNGPHQGAWVDTPDGQDWFLHFQDRGAAGRVVHLQPVRWGDDGWPVIGDAAEGETCGTPVREPRSPHGALQRSPVLPGSDGFTTGYGPQWRWQANPRTGWADAGGGRLRLSALPNDTGNLRLLPQVLGQPLPGVRCTATVSVRLDGEGAGRAGITVLGRDYLWAGLRSGEDGTCLVVARRADGEHDETVLAEREPPADGTAHLRLDVTADARVRVHVRTGEEDWAATGPEFTATPGQWIGAEIGLFATAPLGGPAGPAAAVGPFTLEVTP
ncbi:glycoside hydrolase family 43 protein [Kineococcus arenarius]|uniref:glycoside hydrolase family 43 protein n=1 Tax=unclassified Kineococcus TaxID=2621656 RepID=UPI003D7D1D36